MTRTTIWMMGASLLVAACGDDSATSAASGSGGGASTTSGTPSGSTSATSASSGGVPTTGAGGDATSSGAGAGSTGATTSTSSGAGGSDDGIPGGGTILLDEPFDDPDLASRGWYDGPFAAISDEAAPGSSASFICTFEQGASGCAGGLPARHAIAESESVYLRFWIRFSPNWVGSGVPYHPHMMQFVTNADDDYVGPANTHLTAYTEVVGDRALLALQDARNVDLACILRNDDSFVGCDGDFDSYVFSENRSVCACNGLVGDVDGRDCFENGPGNWYSARYWDAEGAFVDAAGPNHKADWHMVEAYFQMNTIADGVGVPDGRIRWVQDGVVLIASDNVLMRTGQYPDLAFDQFAFLPYIGVGSPIEQSFWVDELVIATARP